VISVTGRGEHFAYGLAGSESDQGEIFSSFAPPVRAHSQLRRAVTAACRRSEAECLPPLVEAATLPEEIRASTAQTARQLIEGLRSKRSRSGVESLIREFPLSSREGLALMCLAEALLRIPDAGTRGALIRDKIAQGNWKAHLGGGRSFLVKAATRGLAVIARLARTADRPGFAGASTRLVARLGDPVICRGVEWAMRMMSRQFVTGETIDAALHRAGARERMGFRHSFDMLGEAAMTAADAERYFEAYRNAIHAIGSASAGRGIYDGPGISIKLSALHPRYCRAQAERVTNELLPKVKELALLAKRFDIGLNIDAEEADRLELSLDLLEDLCLDADLAGWNGLGFVAQAYSKRCPYVLDFIVDLAHRARRRIMVRLVKGAYWDTEIKRAQIDGLDGFAVYTRKVYTDISYIACARKLLAATDAVFPQFATHNAHTFATIYEMAGTRYQANQYEFQCLHGMGEPLYQEVVDKIKLNRPVRIYAPVGTHETLLAYLVRRLLENGANSSFVNRISDPNISVDQLVVDPVEIVRTAPVVGLPHGKIELPVNLYGGDRPNSVGVDLSDEMALDSLTSALRDSMGIVWNAAPQLATGQAHGEIRPVINPADNRDVVGSVTETSDADIHCAIEAAVTSGWGAVPVSDRAACLRRAADAMQARMPVLLGLIVREAGKSLTNAVGEVREAIDFLRYYAEQACCTLETRQAPLGPVVCVSPWNFPLAIFIGQVAAALVAGNPVLAKPAEETPLIAAQGVRILREAGVPADALQLLPGDGRVGAALVALPEVAAVMFTGSTEVARLIQSELAERLSPDGRPIPLIAETGGQNVMIVDSSALAEQVVGDVIVSAFDSAGQRCSALRVLCLQDDVADRTLSMLKDSLRELRIGRTDRLSSDIGPIITAGAKENIERYIETMRTKGRKVEQFGAMVQADHGTFVRPTIVEIESLSDLKREVFGPVLHVLRYSRCDLDRLIDDINAMGYGLTFGLHSRLDETIARITRRIEAGNVYVNRNMIGAVVGLQPFGGRGLSGTGPKAGGPLYLGRLVTGTPKRSWPPLPTDEALCDFVSWLKDKDARAGAEAARNAGCLSALGYEAERPGPVGERNLYSLRPRGRILLIPETELGLYHQLASVLATGNSAVIDASTGLQRSLENVPASVSRRISWCEDFAAGGRFAGALVEGRAERIRSICRAIASLEGPLVPVQALSSDDIDGNLVTYDLIWLLGEFSLSINTTAAGGNVDLMAIG
jgi:RHH-type proline utilization regulon transcriptional repressor/proline dehydrogenase/delta 1-pyrroline-5-carboxylate dehydrogenase